ncbi:MAG: outer membrane beta-barrel protein [Bryobacteraceae bacterium]|nr:outer membrane beta-barrel protein [Bryobacteraceae bacterium]
MQGHKTMLLLALAAVCACPMAAEDNAIEKGESEAVGFAGLADGNLTMGGAFGKGVTDKIFAYGELSFLKGDSASFNGVKASSNAIGFGGGAQYNFNKLFKSNPRWVPYAGAGLSLFRFSAKSSFGGVSASASATDLFLNFGGGLRYYMKPNWGFRPELMIFAGDGSFIRATVGLFYQF